MRPWLLSPLLLLACGDATGDPTGSTSGPAGSSSSGPASTSTSDAPTTSGSSGAPTTGAPTTGAASGSSGDASTGPPGGCDAPPPCASCTCEDDAFVCHCPELAPEAGFLDIEAVDYALGEGDDASALTSSPARLFYSFHPADHDPGDAPLLLFFNGGPGVSTGLLLAGNTGPKTLTDALLAADNPTPWTALGHVLYLDARNTGFSYQTIPDPSDQTKRSTELQTRNFNSYLDAADFVRALLRFWDTHPVFAARPLILIAESYGGIRASILLNMLLFPGDYQTGGPRRYQDPALADAVADHLAARFQRDAPAPELVASVLGTMVLIQPSLAGNAQSAAAGVLLDAPGSPVYELAQELGLTYTPCAQKPQPCDAWANAISFVEGVGRSRYDVDASTTWLFDLFARTRAGLSKRDVLADLLQVEPEAIAGLPADQRAGAFRVRSPGDYISDAEAGDLPDHLGAPELWDRYYLPFSVEVLDGFRSPTAIALGVHSSDPHVGELFLHDLAYARVMTTHATRDLAIWGLSIAPTLAGYADLVADATRVDDVPQDAPRPGELRVTFKPDAFPGEPDPGTRTIRQPVYEASHAITYDQPAAIRDDVLAWLAAGP